MIGRDEIQSLIPHQGAMCLWDEVVEWDASHIRLRARNHRDPLHPLRSGDRLHAVHLCEYGAQAMAVHGGLRAQQAGGVARPGLLVALRDVRLHVMRIDDRASSENTSSVVRLQTMIACSVRSCSARSSPAWSKNSA